MWFMVKLPLFVKARAEIRSKIASANHLGSIIITPERERERESSKPLKTSVKFKKLSHKTSHGLSKISQS